LPPAVVAATDAHVIGHGVQHLPYAMACQLVDVGAVVVFRADLGVEIVRIGNVVTMRAAGASADIGRCIDVTYPQIGQIRHQPGGMAESKAGMELEAICRPWQTRRRPSGERSEQVLRHGTRSGWRRNHPGLWRQHTSAHSSAGWALAYGSASYERVPWDF